MYTETIKYLFMYNAIKTIQTSRKGSIDSQIKTAIILPNLKKG